MKRGGNGKRGIWPYWTAADMANLTRLCERGFSQRGAAAVLKRDPNDVRRMVHKLGLVDVAKDAARVIVNRTKRRSCDPLGAALIRAIALGYEKVTEGVVAYEGPPKIDRYVRTVLGSGCGSPSALATEG